jgi:hypothetical protein
MSEAQRRKIQALLAADASPLREELVALSFDAIVAQPVAVVLGDAGLVPLIYGALTRDNAARVAERHVLPAIERIDAALSARPERLRDAMPEPAQDALRAVVHSGKGPRFGWLRGAIDPAEIRQLVAPAVQQVLIQFTTKLPIPGLGQVAGGGGGGGGGLGGLVGMIGKQVQRSAGQLADVGKSVIGGLGSELERRMQQMARDFTQTAITDFRAALEARMKSDEGRQIVLRIRDRVVEHILSAKLQEISQDLMHLPKAQIAAIVADELDYLPKQVWFREILEAEVAAVLAAIGERSLRELLEEAGLLDEARALTLRAAAPAVRALASSEAFGAWLDRLLEQSKEP